MSRRIRLLAMAIGILAVMAPTAAFAQDELTISPSTVQPGDSFAVSGQCPEGFGGEDAEILAGEGLPGGLLGRATLSDDGSFTADATIAEGSPTTTGEVTVPCPDGQSVLSGELTVADPVPQEGVAAGAGGMAGGYPATTLVALGMVVLVAAGVVGLRRTTA